MNLSKIIEFVAENAFRLTIFGEGMFGEDLIGDISRRAIRKPITDEDRILAVSARLQ